MNNIWFGILQHHRLMPWRILGLGFVWERRGYEQYLIIPSKVYFCLSEERSRKEASLTSGRRDPLVKRELQARWLVIILYCTYSFIYYMGICVLGDGMFTTAQVWRSENKLALLFHHMGPRDQTWAIRLSGKALSPAEPCGSPNNRSYK